MKPLSTNDKKLIASYLRINKVKVIPHKPLIRTSSIVRPKAAASVLSYI